MNLADLGRRAVACKHFYWMPGMSLSNGRTIGTWKEGEVCGSSDTSPPYDGAVYPMLDDPATLGCLLHLVEEAYGHVGIMWSGGEWECWVDVGGSQFNFTGLTKQEALVNALERV